MPATAALVDPHSGRAAPITGHRLRVAALLLAASLIAPLLVLAGPAGPAQAAFGRLWEPSEVPMAGVPFRLDGFLTSTVRRPVKLERVTGSTRTTLARTKANKLGKYVFSVALPAGDYTLRAVARRFGKGLNHPKPRIETKPIKVRVVSQGGTIAALPPIMQQGAAPTSPDNSPVVVARFAPARVGRPVRLEQLLGGTWQTVQNGTQDPAGSAGFTVSPGGSYRAVTDAAGDAPAVVTDVVMARSWQASFEDQFSGNALGPAWADDLVGYNSSGKRTCARQDGTELVRSVSGGTLRMGIAKDPARAGATCTYQTDKYGSGTSPYLLNSQVATRGRYSFTHGVAAARIKLQKTRGMHSGFWLLPANGKIPGNTTAGVEIDVMEFFGDSSSDSLAAFLHWIDAAKKSQKLGGLFPDTEGMKPVGDTWWDSYHVFSVEWTPTEYIFRVDGREFYRESQAVSQGPEYLVLSMLSSDYELRWLEGADYDGHMLVDWVRVWDV